MPIWRRKRHDIADPVFFDPIIADLKKAVRDNPAHAMAWLELGRLNEAKLQWNKRIARNDPLVRYAFPVYLLLTGLPLSVLIPRFFVYSLPVWLCYSLMGAAAGLAMTGGAWIWSLRYPRSGKRYFRKVLGIDPNCGEVYLYLGLIAFRRFQDRKARHFFKKALQLGVSDSQINTANCRGLIHYLLGDKPFYPEALPCANFRFARGLRNRLAPVASQSVLR